MNFNVISTKTMSYRKNPSMGSSSRFLNSAGGILTAFSTYKEELIISRYHRFEENRLNRSCFSIRKLVNDREDFKTGGYFGKC